jgi:hypothetical protein
VTPDEHHEVAFLLGAVRAKIEELDRIYNKGVLAKLFGHRRGTRLLWQCDQLLGRVAALQGEPHEFLPPRRRPRLPGHPMWWVGGQWFFGIFNAWRMIECLMGERWWLAGAAALGIVAALFWNVPPLRLALKGKYNDEP